MSRQSRSAYGSFTRRRFSALAGAAATGGLLVGIGSAALSVGAAAQPGPLPSSPVVSVSLTAACPLERIGTQFVKCDNLTGAGVRAPSHIPGVQRLGLGDHR